jgi:hypothetical protein
VDPTGLTPDKGDLIRRITCHKDCADPFGGLPNVLHAIAVTNYIDVNNIPGVNVEADVLLQQFEDLSVAAFTSAPYTFDPAVGPQVPNGNAMVVNTYYRGNDPRVTAVLLLHELRHGVGHGGEIDTDYNKEYSTVFLLCPDSEVPTIQSPLPNQIP